MNSDNELPKPIQKNGRFDNPWPTWRMPSMWGLFKFAFETNHSNVPNSQTLNKTLPIHKSNFDFSKDRVSMTWIGHSTTVVYLDGLTILTDPIFSSRASFSQLLGPPRYRTASVSIEELPPIDAVVISHNHFDHLDLTSVETLNTRFGSKLYWFVPLGLRQWMRDVGCENVVELDWWQTSSIPSKPDISVILTPAQHWSRRGLTDERKTLWGSWTVIGPKHKFFFTGDSGYCSVFKQIGQKFGPFDLAAIPIGAYVPRWFMAPQHVDPEEAVQIHEDIKSKFSVGIHWGTFALANEYYLEPKTKLKKAINDRKLNENEFITVSHGQTITV